MKFHFELPRLFDRVPFVSCIDYVEKDGTKAQEITVGFGKYTVMLTAGRWFFSVGVF